jgi:hypothetical protein
MSKLLEHFKRMQDMAARYILPNEVPYVDRDGKASTSPDVAGQNDPHGNIRRKLFENDMIYMLDGPEQREAQADALADADKAMVIAEHAFRAGYEAAVEHASPPGPIAYTGTVDGAWAEYELPEPMPSLS